jgi:hypothetical protein
MNKIIEAEDILTDAQNCVECIFLAAGGLGGGLKEEATDPIQFVADIASDKIKEAIAILGEYRGAPDAQPGSGCATEEEGKMTTKPKTRKAAPADFAAFMPISSKQEMQDRAKILKRFDAENWKARVFQGRSDEEIERIKDFLQVTFPRPAAAPDAKPVSSAARPKRGGK